MSGPNRTGKKARQSRGRSENTGRVIKEKFIDERVKKIVVKPLLPMTPLQQEYIELIKTKDIILATGLAGTSKTYIPTVMACDWYSQGLIDKIYITRPAISNSKSLGFFGGDLNEKMANWIGPVLSTMKERLGAAVVEIAIKNEDIIFVPFEVIKGQSFNKAFIICDEAEDMSIAEAKKFVTRIGKNSTAVMAGDISQSELGSASGLKRLADMVERNPALESSTGMVDFNRPSDIVRSDTCREWILAFRRDEM